MGMRIRGRVRRAGPGAAPADRREVRVPEGCHVTAWPVTRHDARTGMIRFVVVRTLGWVALRRLVGLVGLGPGPDAKDVEIAVLRHQLTVLHRQVSPPPVHAERPASAGLDGEIAAPQSVVGVPGDPIDVAAPAPRTHCAQVDLPPHRPA